MKLVAGLVILGVMVVGTIATVGIAGLWLLPLVLIFSGVSIAPLLLETTLQDG